ncbi:MAG TPA: response regulator [Thermoanaerobaculia bacterium]
MDLNMENSMTEVRAVPSLYIVPCPTCSKEMEAHAAEWCHCVAKNVSLSCPHCGNCLCKKSDAVRREFWRNAPKWLTDSRAAELRRRVGMKPATAVERVDVLVVDDDEEIRMLAAYSIQQLGYSVAVAGSGLEALDFLTHCAPRVMITDALMPKMDGRQLCKLVKAGHPDVKVVIMTSLYTAPRYKHEAYKTFHADGYLAKTVDFNQLREVIVNLAPNPLWKSP